MNPEKKVLLLFLLLIGFISFCVYYHLPQFMPQEEVVTVPSTVKEEVIEEKEVTTKKQEPVIDNKIEEESTSIEKKEGNIESTNQADNEIQEEKVEELVVEPLITTDKRYKRQGNEKNIEDLSKTAQELQIKMNDYVKENPIIFKRASYKITKASNKTIKEIVQVLKEFPNIKIEVAGHTDAIGAAKVNQSISQARANSVKKKLVSLGIDENRIIARGYGEDIPLVKNSKNGYSKINRRVEFNIVEE